MIEYMNRLNRSTIFFSFCHLMLRLDNANFRRFTFGKDPSLSNWTNAKHIHNDKTMLRESSQS